MCFKVKKIILSSDFSLRNKDENDYQDESTDVIVLVDDPDENGQQENSKYIASFFAFSYFQYLNQEHFKNGQYLSGTYFHTKNMVLINKCTQENIARVVDHLILEGTFFEVFRKL